MSVVMMKTWIGTNGSQENQEDANGSAQADEYLLEGTTLRT